MNFTANLKPKRNRHTAPPTKPPEIGHSASLGLTKLRGVCFLRRRKRSLPSPFPLPPSRWGGVMGAKTVLTREDIRRAVGRIAHEILERNRGPDGVVLVGMRTRGVPLAARLAAAIQEFEGQAGPRRAPDLRR